MPEAEKKEERQASLEEHSYYKGLVDEFVDEKHHYMGLVHQLMELEARVELAEHRLSLTREHLLHRADINPLWMPKNWQEEMFSVRFVGVRLVDACLRVLSELRSATSEELIQALNNGGFRFRSNTPGREVHAALIKQTASVAKNGDKYVYKGERRPHVLAVS